MKSLVLTLLRYRVLVVIALVALLSAGVFAFFLLAFAGIPLTSGFIGKFAVFHLKGEQVQAVEAINSPAEFMVGRQLIGNRKAVNPVKLADPSVSMKDVAA